MCITLWKLEPLRVKEKYWILRKCCAAVTLRWFETELVYGSYKPIWQLPFLWAPEEYNQLAQTGWRFALTASRRLELCWYVADRIVFVDRIHARQASKFSAQHLLLRWWIRCTEKAWCYCVGFAFVLGKFQRIFWRELFYGYSFQTSLRRQK